MRVMILEDDPWVADLLKRIVLSIRPHAQVELFSDVQHAFEAWRKGPYQLVLADWNLPGPSGVSMLEKIRREDRETPLVIVTGRSDRASVLEVRPLGINAFISKPFQVPRVVECLERLLPPEQPLPDASLPAGDFLDYLANLPAEALDLPLLGRVKSRLQQSLQGQALPLRELAEDWQHDPALSARLIAVANSSAYLGGGRPCLSLIDALRKLGVPTSLSLAMGLALRQSSTLSDALLQERAQAHLEAAEQLAEQVVGLARQSGLEPAQCLTAALLHRMGELCVLYLAQGWIDQGGTLNEASLRAALAKFSAPFAIELKARWQLPMALRELIGAVYALPPAQVRREQVLMRLAAAELGGENEGTLQRLHRLAGLS